MATKQTVDKHAVMPFLSGSGDAIAPNRENLSLGTAIICGFFVVIPSWTSYSMSPSYTELKARLMHSGFSGSQTG